MLTIQSYGVGKCVWCCQTKEGVHATFKDGLTGFFCKKDVWAAIEARAEKKDQSDAELSRQDTGKGQRTERSQEAGNAR